MRGEKIWGLNGVGKGVRDPRRWRRKGISWQLDGSELAGLDQVTS